MKFAEILVNKNQIFTYGVPENLSSSLKVGHEVKVPLMQRVVKGFVLKEAIKPEFKTKEIVSANLDYIFFSQTQVNLCEWISQKYLCYPATALKLILPK